MADRNVIYRKDYAAPSHQVHHLHLDVNILDDKAIITSSMKVSAQNGATDLCLSGEGLTLHSVTIDGAEITQDRLHETDGTLTIKDVPPSCLVAVTSACDPYHNTALEGLYLSQDMLCTQCEPEGFRRICYYLDRPDVLAPFTVRIEADKTKPQLLSNGNLIETGDVGTNRHYAIWQDIHPKPSYLFALVAGDLELVQDSFTTQSGRVVDLHIYVEHGNGHLTYHAMDSLKRSMKWDEDVYGLEYDLDLFQIVAISHFNMGAMENKGLNIFNSKFVLADQNTATDDDLDRVEAIIAHEYFHNWTGNRVTCRDWFQLTLKEGLTVFRDQNFSADMHDKGVKRASDVQTLRAIQFPEDASPTAHPIRPDSFVEINNFYTPTVYEKGAEVIRMFHSQLGDTGFRKGMDLYFARHDGQAVTCDDFIAAMSDANDVDFSSMQRWYSQAGTPHVTITRADHDEGLQISIAQHVPETAANTAREPLPLPIRLGFLTANGMPASFSLKTADGTALGDILGDGFGDEALMMITTAKEEVIVTFAEPEQGPFTPSYLRDFSAPVRLLDDVSDQERLHLLAHDVDLFNRWEAAQKLLEKMVQLDLDGQDREDLLDALANAYQAVLAHDGLQDDFKALLMAMPSQAVIESGRKNSDPVAIFAARDRLRASLASRMTQTLSDLLQEEAVVARIVTAAGRHLQNALLDWFVATGDRHARQQALIQSQNEIMSLSQGALSALNKTISDERDQAMKAFHDKWQSDSLVMEKWFSMSAASPHNGTIETVKSLMAHPIFDRNNPNKMRSALGVFAAVNPTQFHKSDGSGYDFIAGELVELDQRNPQLAARMALSLTRMSAYDSDRQEKMRLALQKVQAGAKSRDLLEVVEKALAAS